MPQDRYVSALQPYISSVPDNRDYPYIPLPGTLPDEVDLRQFTGRIEDQLSEGSCVSNGIVSCCELLTERALGGTADNQLAVDLSRFFVYYNARDLEGRIGQQGTQARNGLRVARHQGICNEDTWPYDLALANVPPSPEAYAEGATQVLDRYERIYHWSQGTPANFVTETERGIRSALSEGLPLVLAMWVGEKIFSVSGPLTGQPYPPIGFGNTFKGTHLMAVVGYTPHGVIVENSWGSGWGDQGYGLISWAAAANNAVEVWAIRGFAGTDVKPPPGIMVRELTRFSLTVRIVPPEPMITTVWVGAQIGTELRLKHSGGSWRPFDGTYTSYLKHVSIDDEMDIDVVSFDDGVDLNDFAGADVYVAYGDDPETWTLVKVVENLWQ